MSVEAQFFEKTKALVSNRCYANTFPQPAPTIAWPAIRYTRIAVDPGLALCGAGDDDEADISLQVDVVAQTYGGAQVLRDRVLEKILEIDPPGIWVGQSDSFDAETKTHRCLLEIAFYQSSKDGAVDSPSV